MAFLLARAFGGSVASVSPTPGSTVTNLTQVTVTFTNTVQNVAPDDLLLNGVPGTNASGSGAVYTYSFSPPTPGVVQVSWNGANLITVQQTNRLTDLSTNTWQYTLLDVVPPAVSAISPVPGATVKQLTQIAITFTEPVTGVGASALRVNGNSANSVSGSGAGPYTFYFNAPPPGSVQVSWANSPGIYDLAGNAFAGGSSWTYSVYPGEFAGNVIINEFMADNASANGLRDEDGTLQSWIELYNRGTNTVNLLGWSLTTDSTVPNLWTFPSVNLGPGAYLVVFASAKNRAPTNGATLHTSFLLSASALYLGLYDANQPQSVATQFSPTYPAQQADISYGLYGTSFTYMLPTPGAPNSAGITYNGDAIAPTASVGSGFFNQSFTLSLSTSSTGAGIRYTLDGSEPTAGYGIPYTGPITISATPSRPCVNVRAVAYRSDLLASHISTFSYIFPSYVIQQPALPAGFPSNWVTVNTNAYSAYYLMDPRVLTNGSYSAMSLQGLTNLPALSIVLSSNALFSQQSGIYANPFPPVTQRAQWEQRASSELIMPDGSKGFKIDAGLTAHGGISRDPARTRKHSLDLKFTSAYDGQLNTQVFEDSPRNNFNKLILGAGNNVRWATIPDSLSILDLFVRDEYSSYLQIAAGYPSGHSRWVNLFLNGLYWGVYYVHEEPDDNFTAAYYGGSSSDYDVMRNTSNGIEVQSGNNSAWTNMMNLVNAGLFSNSQYDQLRTNYLDLDAFIDYMIVKFWAGDMDWGMHNWYASRLRAPGAGWEFKVYDAEWTLINTNDNNTGRNDSQSPTGIHSFLHNNAEYRLRFADRLQRLFFNHGLFYVNSNSPVVNSAQPSNNVPGALFMQREAVIDIATVLESARWGDQNNYYGATTNPFTRNVTFLKELNWIKTNYLAVRSSIVLDQLRSSALFPYPSGILAPSFNQFGGNVPLGFNLTMSAPVGTIYYTTNGVDPRVYGTGNIAPGALTYTGSPVVLNQSMTIMARARNGTDPTGSWSPLTEATFYVAEPLIPMRFTEINYDPPGGSQYEFLELKNTGSASVDLSGYSFSGITYIFPPSSIIAPGAVIVLASGINPSAWTNQYPGVTVFGYYSAHLANEGETIALLDTAGYPIISVTYSPSPTNGWPNASNGSSLEINDLNGDPNDPANWRASSVSNSISGGTPGTVSATPAAGAVQINEIMALNTTTLTNGGTTPAWIELINTSNNAVSLAGWSLSNDGNARKFVFPSGTNIAAGGFLLVFCDSQTSAPGLHSGFTLDSTNGNTLLLYDAITNRVDAVSFGPQVANLSVGRISGAWQLTQPTPGAANQPATTGAASSLSINEWMASPPSGQSDWFELYNSSSFPVPLKGLYLGTSNGLFLVTSLSFVSPGGFVQLIADKAPGANHVDFHLPAAGSELVLYDAFGNVLNGVTWGQQTSGISQGRLPDGSTNIVFFPGSASPGAPNYVVSFGGGTGVQLNEIMARNNSVVVTPWGNYSDWIELYNPGATSTNLSGMSLSVNQLQPGQWVFPAGTTIAAGGYLVVWCDATRSATTNLQAGFNLGQSLDGNSGSVYLFNATNQVVDYVEWGFQIANQSIGRIAENWYLLATNTPGATNAAAVALGAPANVRINEWMAQPASGSSWFELYNLDPLPVSLGGLYLSDDPSIAGLTEFQVPPLSFIPGQGWIKWDADGHPSNGRNHVNFQLSATGESLLLYDTALTLIDAVYFSGQQTSVSQGRLPDGSGTVVSFPATASPGAGNYLPLTNAVVNEVLSHTDPPLEDAIELANLTAAPLNIGGWFLSDSESQPKKFRIPDGTTIPANGFKVFYQYQFDANPGTSTNFALDSAHGDSVYLSQADAGGNLSGSRTAVSFGAAENGVSFGRYTSSTAVEFVAMSQRTFGMDAPTNVTQFRTGTGLTNAYPKVGPVVINELNYYPVNVVGTNLVESYTNEFVELYNLSTNSVGLFDSNAPTNTWRLDGGISFSFPTGVVMTAKSYLLAVNFDPATNTTELAAFRSLFGVATNIPIFGPYQHHLGNSGDQVELYKPDPPSPAPDAGFVPFILVDHVDYLPTAPWPVAAAGGGASLQRLVASAYGNDPLNWKADLPTAGRTNAPSGGTTPPLITTQPQSQTVLAGSNVVFSVGATGNPPPVYQWQHQGTNLMGATDVTLTISNAQPANSGSYQVWVTNTVGSIYSQPATLSVFAPPVITVNPSSQSVPQGGNVTLQVTVTGTEPLAYQWYFNTLPLPTATSASLALTNVDPSQAGTYQVIVTNSVGQATSQSAYLTVLATDSDGDGIPDWWMNLHFGHPTGKAYDHSRAQDDPDGDGMSNLKEYLSGTDPLNPNSCLRLQAGAGIAGSVKFTAVAGLTYTMQFSTNLLSGIWFKLMDVPSDPTTRLLNLNDSGTTNAPYRFYRVVTPLQP